MTEMFFFIYPLNVIVLELLVRCQLYKWLSQKQRSQCAHTIFFFHYKESNLVALCQPVHYSVAALEQLFANMSRVERRVPVI